MSDAYQVHPELASAGYRVLRPDGSTLCVVCGHAKATAVADELNRLAERVHQLNSENVKLAEMLGVVGCDG